MEHYLSCGALKGCGTKRTVIVADDSDINRSMMSLMLKEKYNVLQAKDGAECVDILTSKSDLIDLVLLDIVMPGLDGFGVLAKMKSSSLIERVPVIMITAHDSADNIERAYEMGAFDCISRPFDSSAALHKIENAVTLYDRQRSLQKEIVLQNVKAEKCHRLFADISGSVIGYGSGESNTHLKRTAWIVSLLLDRLKQKTDKYFLPPDICDCISAAASLHDIGKVGIDRSILNKPGRLTDEEYRVVKEHTVIGESIIKSIDNFENEPFLQIAAEICRWHHERYDGGGYPDGLAGDDIPISAQVVGIADVYDALVSDRVYSPAVSGETAFRMIENGECGAFSPIMLECLREIKPILLESKVQ